MERVSSFHLDAADGPIDGAEHVIVDDVAFETHAQQAGLHSCGFVDEISAGMACQSIGVGLFVARLCIGNFGVGHTGRYASRQIVVSPHLTARCSQHGLFTAAATHGAGSQVGDKRPGTENSRMLRRQQIDIYQPCQYLGDCLDNRTGE